ncbi:MAG: universal stress protein [Gammaproteobacteria bacterium]|jgi:nucleotide-binding universal stress UspA family protein
MAAVNHILVPTDGSAGALKAAAFAGELARALKARVSLLFVHAEEVMMSYAWGPGDYPAGSPYGALSMEDVRNMLEQRAREKDLPETVSALGKLPQEPQSTLVWGHPAEEICRFANEHDVDLVVMGSHGRSGLKRVLLGSVSHAVANEAPCPVTIVR